MRPLVLVLALATIVGVVVCVTAPSVAQPAPPPAPAPEPARPAPAPAAPPTSAAAPPASLGSPSQVELPGAAQPEPQPRQARGRRLSASTALALSLGGTALSWGTSLLGAFGDNDALVGLGLVGTFLAPNMGHWYQGGIVTRGTGLRLVGGLLVGYRYLHLVGCEGNCDPGYDFYGGLLLYFAATIDDIITAPLRVRKHNQRLEAIGLTPVVTNHSAGLALSGRF